MDPHHSSALAGPVTWTRSWWPRRADEPAPRKRASRRRNAGSRNAAGDNTAPEPEIRQELVDRVRREIAEGTYETPEKWDEALRRLLERLDEE